jgi:hypothetical protein
LSGGALGAPPDKKSRESAAMPGLKPRPTSSLTHLKPHSPQASLTSSLTYLKPHLPQASPHRKYCLPQDPQAYLKMRLDRL